MKNDRTSAADLLTDRLLLYNNDMGKAYTYTIWNKRKRIEAQKRQIISITETS